MTGEPTPSAANVPQDARRAVGKLLGFLLVQGAIAGGVSLFGGEQWYWLGVSGSLVVAVAAWLTLPGGPFAKDARAISPAQRVSAALMLIAYLAVSIYAGNSATLASALLTSTCFAAASTMLLWPTLRVTVSPFEALWGVALMLAGVGSLLSGASWLVDGQTPENVMMMLQSGVVCLLSGISALVDVPKLAAVELLGFAVAFLSMGIVALTHRETLFGVVGTVLGGVCLAWGVTLLAGRVVRLVGAGLVTGVAGLLLSVASFVDGQTLAGVAFLLAGFGGLSLGMWARANNEVLWGVAFLLLGIGLLLIGILCLVVGVTFADRWRCSAVVGWRCEVR